MITRNNQTKTAQEYEDEINQLVCTVEALTHEINEQRTKQATSLLLKVLDTLNEDESGETLQLFEPLFVELAETLDLVEEKQQEHMFKSFECEHESCDDIGLESYARVL